MDNNTEEAVIIPKGEKTMHLNQNGDFQITMTLLLAIVLVILQGVLGYLWIGFFIITHSLMAIASAFLAVMWISNRADKRAEEV